MTIKQPFDEWVEENEKALIAYYVSHIDHGMQMLDDDLPDLPDNGEFQEWCQDIYDDGGLPEDNRRIL